MEPESEQTPGAEPRPEQFGLSREKVDYFNRKPRSLIDRFHESNLLTSLWAWVSFALAGFTVWILGLNFEGLGGIVFFFLAGAYFVFAFAILSCADRVASWSGKHEDRSLPGYSAYLQFLRACEDYQEARLRIYANRRAQVGDKLRTEEQEKRRKEEWWRSLSGYEFEKELYQLFRQRGYDVQWVGGAGGDGGVDLLLKVGQKKVIVQCKAYKGYISPAPVRELFGTVIHSNADEGWLVTTSGFYGGARSFARGKPIRLFTIRDVLGTLVSNVIRQLASERQVQSE